MSRGPARRTAYAHAIDTADTNRGAPADDSNNRGAPDSNNRGAPAAESNRGAPAAESNTGDRIDDLAGGWVYGIGAVIAIVAFVAAVVFFWVTIDSWW